MNSLKDKVALSPDAVYVILGASGTTGSIIVDSLLSKGKKVSVVGPDLERLHRFVRQGAEALTYVSDAAALTKAFSGARAAYLMPQPKSREDQERESDAMAKAVTESGLRYAVDLLEQLRRAGSRRDRANLGAAFFGAKTERDQRFECSAPARCVFHGEQSGGD